MNKVFKEKLFYIISTFILVFSAPHCFCVENDSLRCAEPLFTKQATFTCGRQPKQVLFSPDSNCIVLPLLDDKGFQVLAINKTAVTSESSPEKEPHMINPPNSKKVGFAEGLFIPEKKAFFVSQMTTANIYEYEYPGFTYKRTISTEAVWSKFIAWNSQKQMLAVSNWVSNDVSLISYDSGKVIRKLKTAAAPRGLAFIKGGDEIIVLCFDGGAIQKFNTATGEKIASLSIANSAMRHIVINKDETTAYISDMHNNAIYAFDLHTFSITNTYSVFNNPNTIALLKNRYIIVSSRGPNNPVDYTRRSPVNGKITIIDTAAGSTLGTLPGGNQPTGLAVSPDEKYLCFSNFQDEDIELYKINFAVFKKDIPFYTDILLPAYVQLP